jgi:hypothetical protein
MPQLGASLLMTLEVSFKTIIFFKYRPLSQPFWELTMAVARVFNVDKTGLSSAARQ